MKATQNVLVILGVTLISACAYLEQPPAPNDTVTRLSNEMKLTPRAVPPKVDPRDVRIAELERQLADRDAKLADLDRELAALRSSAGGSASLAASELAKSKTRISDLEKQLAAATAEMALLRAELSASEQKLAKVKKGLGLALKPEIDKGNITLDLNDERLLISLASSMLFKSGDAQLNPEGDDVMRRVGGVLKDYPEYKTEVSGHTDDVKIAGKLKEKFPTNKELSQARANSALQQMREGGLQADSSTAVGYADTKPVVPNATAEGRQKNRRVEIRLTPK